jgi:NADH-quinone oxidoreductase subunit E
MERMRKFEKVCTILSENNNNPHKLIPILQAVQAEYRYLPEEVMAFVATSLGLSPAKVFGVASFYSHFTLKPKGKYVIKICDGTACHVKKSMEIATALAKQLGLNPDRNTTGDMLFTLETVSCLGTCGLAPAMVVNEAVHGLLTPEAAVAIIRGIQEKEAAAQHEDGKY